MPSPKSTQVALAVLVAGQPTIVKVSDALKLESDFFQVKEYQTPLSSVITVEETAAKSGFSELRTRCGTILELSAAAKGDCT